MDAKPKKKSNFLAKEKDVLLSEIVCQKDVILSKLKCGVSQKKKRAVWENIAHKVNAVGGNGRTWDQCAKKWRDLRTAVESKKIYSRGTGGGEAAPPAPYEDIVLAIIGLNTTKTNGIDGGIDTVMVEIQGEDFEEGGTGSLLKRDHQEQTAASVIDLPLQYSPANGLMIIEENVSAQNESTSSTTTTTANNVSAQNESTSSTTTTTANTVSAQNESTSSTTTTTANTVDRSSSLTPSTTTRPVSRTEASSGVLPRRLFQKKRPRGVRNLDWAAPASPEEENALFKEWLHSEIDRNKAQTEREKAQTEKEKVETEFLKLHIKKLKQELLVLDNEKATPPSPAKTA